jgi:hypothetical protein
VEEEGAQSLPERTESDLPYRSYDHHGAIDPIEEVLGVLLQLSAGDVELHMNTYSPGKRLCPTSVEIEAAFLRLKIDCRHDRVSHFGSSRISTLLSVGWMTPEQQAIQCKSLHVGGGSERFPQPGVSWSAIPHGETC